MKNLSKIKLLIFDFDGTLFDTSLDIANAVNFGLKQFGKEELDPFIVWSYTGDGLLNTIKRAFSTNDINTIQKAYEIILQYYEEHSGENSKPIDNVLEFLDKDKRRKVILSNKNFVPMLKVLEKFKIKEKFEKIYGFDNLPFAKPDPRTVDFILNETGVERNEAVIIGDADQDIQTAKNANIRCYIIPSKPINMTHQCILFKDYNELELLLDKT
ncbi:HAD family hydrolase [Caldisericum sp.]|uniref:HAD family hydrolase n=1 Tax=Caldisericum sp. TaxID=2499687 RepID=UPI003D0A1435